MNAPVLGALAALAATFEVAVAIVEALDDGDLARPTPCSGWRVGDVLEHAAEVTVKFTEFATGVTDSPHARPFAGHPRNEFAGVCRDALAAWAVVDRSRTCHLPFGDFTAAQAAGINLFDMLAHSWDIAVAVDRPVIVPDGVWAVALDAARSVVGPERDVRHYGAEVSLAGVENPLPQKAFLAYLGRDPAWRRVQS
jgi:uncharacterized protein (TIGR03086 family)